MSSFRRPRKRIRAPTVRFWKGWSARGREGRGCSDASTGSARTEEGLDLASFVETRAAHKAVGNASPDKRLLDGAGLRVGAVHHGDVVTGQRFIGSQSLNLLDDEERLVLLVIGLVEDYGATARVF